MARKGSGRGRKGPAGKRPVKPKIMLMCQGTETEPRYFQLFQAEYRVPNMKVKKEALDPKRLVEKAATLAKKDGDYSKIFVIVDVDDFTQQNLEQAKSACTTSAPRGSSMALVVSNESFDCWLAAHITDHKLTERGRGEFQKQLIDARCLSGRNNKTLSADFPVKDWEKAERNLHSIELSTSGTNPSSAMPTLIRTLLDK